MVCQCNESVVGLTLSFISSCNHLRCTYSNSCNWRVATKLYISPRLPHCRLLATLMSWSWSAYHWHHNQYLCNWHINHSRSPSKHVCTNHQHWSASWLVGTLKNVLSSGFLQKPAHNSGKLALFTIQACVHRHQPACHWVDRVGWGCTVARVGVLKTTPPILSPRAFSLSYIKSSDFQNDLGLFFYRTIS